jgi:long-chain fatty acid transport protein
MRAVAVCALAALAAAPAKGAGFGIFEQGARAMGMAGAFTAQADDGSALFHNPGGLAFATETQLSAGFTFFKATEADFAGANPFPGTGVREDQKLLSEILPHAYWVKPLGPTWKVGVGLNAPFGLTTEWKHPDRFSGRFFSTKAALRVVDLNPTLGWQLTPNFGLGFGAILRFSDVELRRNIPAINPFTLRAVDVGRLTLESDFDQGYGFNLGMLHKVNNSFSWGLSYRSKVKVDYSGAARVTQVPTGNPQFDALVRTRLPFDTDLPVETEIEFPDMASLGFAFALSPRLLLETDVNWTGWSSFDEVPINFTGGATNSLPDSSIPENWDDAYNYRAGLRWTRSQSVEWRFGYVFDETPQPEEAVSPLLPDANRNGVTVGYGYTGSKLKADVALMYLDFDERTRARSFPGEADFFGTYNTKAWLLGITVGF